MALLVYVFDLTSFSPFSQIQGSTLFKLDPETKRISLRTIGNSTKNVMDLSDQTEDKKLYLRLRATDKAGHITESQLVIHILTDETTRKSTVSTKAINCNKNAIKISIKIHFLISRELQRV